MSVDDVTVIDDMAEAIVMDDPFDDRSEEMRNASNSRRAAEMLSGNPDALRGFGLLALLFVAASMPWPSNDGGKDGANPCGGACGCRGV